ncbi:cupin domain-containing protein [Gillisia sp. CAL575]|uniref:cupin domain-containing protein n=1 Tax=Gillisia sp. CAL575 TaxID=985255 RepID=UPI0003A529BA|nr:cupin domain-containing protein [Gillisia sp. CAL575]
MKREIKLFSNIGLYFFIIAFSPVITYAQESDETILENSVVINPSSSKIIWGPCPEFMPEGCEVAILHGDPTKKNADILFRLPANTDFPNHWHNSPERMVLLSGELEITYEGENTQTMKQGNYAYGPAKKPHYGKCGNAGPCLLFIALEDSLDAMPIDK